MSVLPCCGTIINGPRLFATSATSMMAHNRQGKTLRTGRCPGNGSLNASQLSEPFPPTPPNSCQSIVWRFMHHTFEPSSTEYVHQWTNIELSLTEYRYQTVLLQGSGIKYHGQRFEPKYTWVQSVLLCLERCAKSYSRLCCCLTSCIVVTLREGSFVTSLESISMCSGPVQTDIYSCHVDFPFHLRMGWTAPSRDSQLSSSSNHSL